VAELVGEPETLLIDSTLLSVMHPREVSHNPRASRARPGCGGAPSASMG
jgi:hypothetical protein